MSGKERKITVPLSIGYGITDIMGGGVATIISAWLLFFLITFAGLTPAQAGSIIMIARIVDAIASLAIGSLTDNLIKYKIGRKFGRRRFFMMIGSPLILIYAMLWVTGMSYWYYLFVFVAIEVIVAMILIPWETLPSEMTKDFNGRTKLSTGRMFLSATGTFLATFVPSILISFFGEGNAHAYFINGAFFAVLFSACVFISYKVTWERELTPEEEAELLAHANKESSFSDKVNSLVQVLKDYASTLKVKTFRKHLMIYLLSFTGKDVFNTVFIFFTVYALNSNSALAGNLLSLSVVGIPTTLLAGYVVTKIGPGNLYRVAYSLMLVCLVGFYAVYLMQPSSMIIILGVLMVFYQMGRATLEFTPWNVFPFIPECDEIVTKQRREGLFAAVMTFTRKSSVAVATFIVSFILEAGGYVEGAATQSPEAVNTIIWTIMLGTGGLLLGALLFTFSFKLNKDTHGILVAEIDRLKNNGSKHDVDPKTKEVVETLTGVAYENVWRDDNDGSSEGYGSEQTAGV